MSQTAATLYADDSGIFGRDRERSALGALLDQARAGSGSIVLVGGEAGIGKTTLARDLARRATGREMLVLTGFCYDLTVTPPYGPWAHIVRMASRIGVAPDSPVALLDEEALRQPANQQALFQELEDFLVAVSARQPLALILEDLHWADPASLEFLRWFGHQLDQRSIMVAVTYRDGELTRRHPLYEFLPVLVRESPVHRMTLRPLDDRAVLALVNSRYQLPDDDTARLVSYLRGRSEGNPLYLGEVLRTLEEEERIRPAGAGWSVGDLEHVAVPSLVRQVIDGRLSRLGDDVRGVLEIAAVIGQDVPLALWSVVSGRTEEDLSLIVGRAIDAHLLEDARDGSRLRFTHALVREALYEGIRLPQRRSLHRSVAEALMARQGVEPDTIAYHLREAGDSRAIEWYIRAGTRAERVAWLMAAEHLTAALHLAREHGIPPGERGWLIIRLVRLLRFADQVVTLGYVQEALECARAARDDALVAYATFCGGEAHFYQGSGAQGIAEMRAALEMLRNLTDIERATMNDLVHSGIAVSDIVLKTTLAAGLSHTGAISDALEIVTGVMSDVAKRGTPAPAEAQWALGLAHALAGEPAIARRSFAIAREQFRATHDYVMAGSTAFMDLVMAVMVYETDNIDAREKIVAEAEQAWTRSRGAHGTFSPEVVRLPLLTIGGQWSTVEQQVTAMRPAQMTALRKNYLLSLLAWIAREQARPDVAWEIIRAVMPDGYATAPGNTHFVAALNLLNTATSLALDAHDLAAARLWLEAADRWLGWGGAVLGRADTRLLWAAWHRAAAGHDAALRCATQALETASDPRQPLALLRIHRMLGELQTTANHLPEAEQHLQESLRLATACAATYEHALTLIALAELRIATGKSAEAASLLDDARVICVRLEARPARSRIEALTAQLGQAGPAREFPGGLSEREVEVLRLAAQGLTNAQIGGQLFLSPRTVEHHLRSVYQKLNVSSRAGATRFAVEHDLV
jgi:DNA-binding CsgD family transcriptional regulator